MSFKNTIRITSPAKTRSQDKDDTEANLRYKHMFDGKVLFEQQPRPPDESALYVWEHRRPV